MQEDLAALSSCTRKLTLPVLAWGGQAFLGNIVPMWQTVAEQVQGGEVERYGHFIPEERPEFVKVCDPEDVHPSLCRPV